MGEQNQVSLTGGTYIRMTGDAVAEAVERLELGVNVTPRFAAGQIKAGRLNGIRLGQTRWTTEQDIREWIASCRYEPNHQSAQAV